MSAPHASSDARWPDRAKSWRLRSRQLNFTRVPALMGIVNVTPDSFSDGGRFVKTESAVAHALSLAADGADVIDIGGESTRPFSQPVDLDEELRRVIPVVRSVCRRSDVPVSIDTSKADVAAAAIDAGAEIINDVTGLEGDRRMVQVASDSQAAVCVMHMRGTPQTMQIDPSYTDVVEEIYAYLTTRRGVLIAAGIAPDRICLDPGIGFGKTTQHNLILLRRAGRFHAAGCPILVGHSRKGFLSNVAAGVSAQDSAATVGAALAVARQGVQVLRVHDVASIRESLALFAACGGLDDGAPEGLSSG